MAQTAHKTEEEKKEYFDNEDILDHKINSLAELILKSKHFIAFTGAGISTSAGIPDYRSGINTVLPTGPGCWEKLAQGQKSNKQYIRKQMLKALPTPTHMALVELEKKGYLKFLISQNVDGLHRRSGFPASKLSEVHGNTNLEICMKCKKQYLRDFKVRTAQKVHDHQTGRKCPDAKCKGDLKDSIINFGENLPERELNVGFQQAEMADLCIAMGSSLRVTPAANMPETVGAKNRNLVIINLQETPLDSLAVLKINALCDQVMIKLMEKLKIAIPEFILKRNIELTKNKQSLQIRGVDDDGLPYSLFQSIDFQINKSASTKIDKEPFTYHNVKESFDKNLLNLQLHFHGHYGEPNYKLPIQLENLVYEQPKKIILCYNPKTGIWIQQ